MGKVRELILILGFKWTWKTWMGLMGDMGGRVGRHGRQRWGSWEGRILYPYFTFKKYCICWIFQAYSLCLSLCLCQCWCISVFVTGHIFETFCICLCVCHHYMNDCTESENKIAQIDSNNRWWCQCWWQWWWRRWWCRSRRVPGLMMEGYVEAATTWEQPIGSSCHHYQRGQPPNINIDSRHLINTFVWITQKYSWQISTYPPIWCCMVWVESKSQKLGSDGKTLRFMLLTVGGQPQ